MTLYERGRRDCALDDMENAHFSSVGGLDSRDKLQHPRYIADCDADEYLRGYIDQAVELYGEDWKTAEFTWKPVLTINPREEN